MKSNVEKQNRYQVVYEKDESHVLFESEDRDKTEDYVCDNNLYEDVKVLIVQDTIRFYPGDYWEAPSCEILDSEVIDEFYVNEEKEVKK